MITACTVITDDAEEAREVALEVIPRVGETLSLNTQSGNNTYRVRNIEHTEATDAVTPSVLIHCTSQLL